MKLTLQHLAPYLPYQLKVKHQSSLIMEMTAERVKGDFLSIESVLDGVGMPLLRNLSDLTKEIEVNGERFVPIERLMELCERTRVSAADLKIMLSTKEATQFPYWVIQKLSEWHFDWQGLGERGFAVTKTN